MHAMSAIERVLSPPLCRPFRTKNLAQQDHEKPTLNADGYLEFAPGDIESPRNWPVWRRWLITFAMVALVINATFASSAPSGCVHSIANHFNVSTIAAALTITLFLLGYCAGPLFLAPLSELYGRRWVFYITFSLYIIFNFLCAFAPNFGSLLVGRFLSGTFVSSALSNGPGVLGDIWDTIDRGTAMGVWSTMIWVGPALGPVVGGFLELKKDWRWIFYVLLWFGGLTIPIMLTIPETHGPTILRHKARRIRKAQIPGFENIKARSEESDQSLTSTFKVALTRPCLLLFDPISFLCALYLSVVYMLLYMLFEIYPIVFQEKRGWNSGVGELPLIGTVVGALLGGLIVVIDSARQKRKVERGTLKMEDIEPESRMPMAMFGGIGFAACMFWLAWTAQYNSIHWIVPTLAGTFLAMSMYLIFVAYLTYIVDCYLQYSASAMAANTVARSACGAAAPLFANQMFARMGVGGGGSLIGGVAVLLAIIPFVFYKYGRQIRLRSKYAVSSEQEEEKQRVFDEEVVTTDPPPP